MAIRQNISGAERSLRSFVAAIISILYFSHTIYGIAGDILLVIGANLLFNGLTGFSPVYHYFDINTKPPEERPD